MTECNQSGFGFEACGSREIVARFDGGTISSDAGAFLLRQTDKRLNLLPRLVECFLDGRNQDLVEDSRGGYSKAREFSRSQTSLREPAAGEPDGQIYVRATYLVIR